MTGHFLSAGDGLHLVGGHQNLSGSGRSRSGNRNDQAEEFPEPGGTLDQSVNLDIDGFPLFFDSCQRLLRGGLDLFL